MSSQCSLPISLTKIRDAMGPVRSMALRTPLVRLNIEDAQSEIYLKLENLQPVGAYKIRGAANAVLKAASTSGVEAVWTASTGNMAKAVAWVAQRLGLKCQVVVPEFTPKGKLDAIADLGAKITRVHAEQWFEIVKTHHYPGMSGHFIHPVADSNVMAGHGTMGLEIFEDLPETDAVIIPYGGGGLTTGLGSALRALNPDISIYACEVETAAPLAAALKAGEPCIVDYKQSFVDGIGSSSVLPEMWPGIKSLVNDSLVVSILAVANAIRLLVERNHVVAEGAGATSVAAALSGGNSTRSGIIVAIITGGNIENGILSKILENKYPS